MRLADKLRAIAVDNDLAGDGKQAEAQDDFAAWVARVQKHSLEEAADSAAKGQPQVSAQGCASLGALPTYCRPLGARDEQG
jgi:hypothetical protein